MKKHLLLLLNLLINKIKKNNKIRNNCIPHSNILGVDPRDESVARDSKL